MKKILVIDNVNYTDYPTGGIMNFYRNMLQAFGNNLLLAGISTDEETPTGKWIKKNIEGVEYDYYSMAYIKKDSAKPLIPERIKNLVHVRKHIKRILSRNDFDIIFTQTPEVMFSIPDKYLDITCNYLPGVGSPIKISRYPWARKFAGFYDRFIQMPKASKAKWLIAAADQNAREKFAERSRGLIKAERIIQFPTRYNENYYHIYNDSETNKNKDCISFITVGRLGWFKGWKFMIDSFKVFHDEQPKSKLFFIGDGEDEAKIRKYITELNLEEYVILLGKKHPKEIGKLLNSSDVFIMGSMAEGWSTTLVEACACGIPCVVTNFSSAKEMIKNGINGFVIEDRDIDNFALCMNKALDIKRDRIIEYNKRYTKYALCNLKDDLLKIFAT